MRIRTITETDRWKHRKRSKERIKKKTVMFVKAKYRLTDKNNEINGGLGK